MGLFIFKNYRTLFPKQNFALSQEGYNFELVHAKTKQWLTNIYIF